VLLGAPVFRDATGEVGLTLGTPVLRVGPLFSAENTEEHIIIFIIIIKWIIFFKNSTL